MSCIGLTEDSKRNRIITDFCNIFSLTVIRESADYLKSPLIYYFKLKCGGLLER